MLERHLLDLPEPYFYHNIDLETEDEIRQALNVDDRPRFIDFMIIRYGRHLAKTNKLEEDVPETIEAPYCPSTIFKWVCTYGAVDCAKALLEGDPFVVDPNVPFKRGVYPLHIVAEDFSYDMVDLLLCHGAWTDVRTIDGEYRGGLLPLNIALEMLSYHRYLSDWTPKQSVFKLIIILSLPQMKVPLETNRLLAWNTKDVNNIFNHYAMEGNLIPMVALLMVAREKIVASSTLQSKDNSRLDGGMMIRQWILEEIALQSDEEVELMCSGKNCNQRLKNKKAVMTNALLLLKVFDRAGDAIETYRQSVRYHMSKEKVVKDVKALLEESGFVLKDKDIDLNDIDCENEDIKLATEVLEKRTSFRSQLNDLSMPGSFRQAKDPITNKLNEQRWALYKFLPLGSPVFTLSRPDYTFECHDDFTYAIPFFRFPSMNKSGTGRTAMKIPAAYFLTRKDFVALALSIKRGFTRI